MTSLRKLVITAALAGLTSAASAFPYDSLFIFGDSLSDPGNNALLIGSDASQTITGNTYIPFQPYASQQYTNGNVWAYSFASAIGLGPFAGPVLGGGGNLAFGGARTSADGPYAGFPFSLKAQTALYLAATGNTASANGLYVVAGGGNDARDALEAAAADPGNAAGIIAAAAATYAADTGAIVDALQAAGAKHIVVWDVPNIGIAPAVTAMGGSASMLASFTSATMSLALADRLNGEAGVNMFDIFGLTTQWAADPGAFGFANATDACGAIVGCDPSTFAFWDGIHPTSAGHALIANAMIAVAVPVPEPETYVLMVAGLALVAWRVRRRA